LLRRIGKFDNVTIAILPTKIRSFVVLKNAFLISGFSLTKDLFTMRKPLFSNLFTWGCSATLGCTLLANSAFAKPTLPSATQALELTPVQSDIDFAKPNAAKLDQCTVTMETIGNVKSYLVKNEIGQILRRFSDTNNDTKVDTWCYFNDGIEIYRDIDTDGNGKADQYRWFGVAGMRWALDKDEDTRIDSWKQISAEEASEEVVQAIKNNDLTRFKRVLLSSSEAAQLPIPADRSAELERTITAAAKDFSNIATNQKIISKTTKWASFGGGKPGAITNLSTESTPDIVVYDNVAAMLETDGKHAQVAIGTMVKIGEGWRVIDVPRNLLDENNSNSLAGFFFQAPLAKGEENIVGSEQGISPEMQKLVADLEKIDKDIMAATSTTTLAKLNALRADLVERISELATGNDRETWIKQYAETVSAAVQSGGFPEGSSRLKGLRAKLAKQTGQEDLIVFVGFRALQTDYNQSLASADGKESEIGKIREAWISGLEGLVSDYGKSSEAAEPMLALAQECELEGKEEQAIRWYGRIASDFPESSFAPKAKGAKRRLESLGKTFTLSGNTIDGKPFNSSALVGRTTVIYYWATWYDKLGDDFTTLKNLQAKYGKSGFQVVGINLDSNREEALKALKATTPTWPTLYESGGFDSRFANEMGIFSLPVVVMLDKSGKVISRSVNIGELEAELRKTTK
jgi:Thioredoxin-like